MRDMPADYSTRTHLLAFCFMALCLNVLRAEDWPNFRGPHHNGTSEETVWTDQWPEAGPKTLWKAAVGLGFSSMVVGDGRFYSAGHASNEDTVFCLDAQTGKEIWRHSYPSELGAKYYEGGTTGTPTLDGTHLYWLSRWGDLFAFEAATGQIIWNTQVQKETGIRIPDWGFTGAPYVHQNMLVLNIGDAGLGVDKRTGKILWQSADKNAGYSTPLPFNFHGESLVVFGSAQSYVAIHPANGKESWRVKWLTEYGVNAANPIIVGNKIFISTGYGKGAGLFDLAETPPKQLWTSKALRTQLNAGVYHDGAVYGTDGDTGDKAPLKCVDFQTGKERWSEPAFGTGGLLIAGGKIIALTATGELIAAPASPAGFKPTARAQVLGGKCWTAPVLANGRIYCRNSRGEIACINVRPETTALK
ncbi:MAG TPA: PQQ-binding-like beta-propeller repeat protein [Verrucomicrobiae bacterium]|nr:PQQ-binding-like beta-propeller repeat protein [Verrucomicrobiae bacterium]